MQCTNKMLLKTRKRMLLLLLFNPISQGASWLCSVLFSVYFYHNALWITVLMKGNEWALYTPVIDGLSMPQRNYVV